MCINGKLLPCTFPRGHKLAKRCKESSRCLYVKMYRIIQWIMIKAMDFFLLQLYTILRESMLRVKTLVTMCGMIMKMILLYDQVHWNISNNFDLLKLHFIEKLNNMISLKLQKFKLLIIFYNGLMVRLLNYIHEVQKSKSRSFRFQIIHHELRRRQWSLFKDK